MGRNFYNGSEQELIAVGEATGGTMQYALGTDATTVPSSGWGASIPTGTEAGTYYVWYKVVGDDNHNDTDASCVIATIAENSSGEPKTDDSNPEEQNTGGSNPEDPNAGGSNPEEPNVGGLKPEETNAGGLNPGESHAGGLNPDEPTTGGLNPEEPNVGGINPEEPESEESKIDDPPYPFCAMIRFGRFP